jgi:uncharacterized protein (DUF4415 family)
VAINWDPEKSVSNIGKHGVRFAEVVPVLEDPLAITLLDDESDPLEQRFVTGGGRRPGANPGGSLHVARRRHPFDFRPACRTSRTGGIRKTMKTYDFSKGKRGAVLPLPPGKQRITIRLDRDILDYFLDQVERAGGGNYQTLINNVLRDYIEGKKTAPELEDILRRVIREELHP